MFKEFKGYHSNVQGVFWWLSVVLENKKNKMGQRESKFLVSFISVYISLNFFLQSRIFVVHFDNNGADSFVENRNQSNYHYATVTPYRPDSVNGRLTDINVQEENYPVVNVVFVLSMPKTTSPDKERIRRTRNGTRNACERIRTDCKICCPLDDR